MAGKVELVEQVKTMQRTDPYGRQVWWEYCENHLGGVKDPNRHDESTLSTFIGLYQSGSLPVTEPRPMQGKGSSSTQWGTSSVFGMGGQSSWTDGGSYGGGYGGGGYGGGGYGAGGGGYGGGYGGGGYPMGTLGEFVKTGQRQSKHWTNAWMTYCALYGGGINDPSKHEDSFTKSFIEYVGEIAANGLSALASSQGINLDEIQAQSNSTKRPMSFSGGGPPAKQSRWDTDNSAQKQSLVEKVKDLQRSNPQSRESWWTYCDNQCGGMRDPMRHDANSLEAWLASQGAS